MFNIREILKPRRKQMGLSQEQLAEKAGVSQGVISKYEGNEPTKFECIPELLEALDLIVVDKFSFTPERVLACLNRIEKLKEIKKLHLSSEDTAKAISLMAQAVDVEAALDELTEFIENHGEKQPLVGDEKAIRIAIDAVNQVAADKGIPKTGLTLEQKDRAFLTALNTLQSSK